MADSRSAEAVSSYGRHCGKMLVIRPETKADQAAVRQVNERAFGRAGEADLVDALRENAEPQISLVAELEVRVVGHIFFSPVLIESDALEIPSLNSL